MMDLLTPTNHAGAYEWAAVLFAHATVGLIITAIVAAILHWQLAPWIEGLGGLALVIVVVLYFLGWEGSIQQFGAGMPDAIVDTFAVFIGGLIGVSA